MLKRIFLIFPCWLSLAIPLILPGSTATPAASAQPPPSVHSLGDLLLMQPEELAKVDLAEMFLVCASDLPGVKVDTEACLEMLCHWTAKIRAHPPEGDAFMKARGLLEMLKRERPRFNLPLSLTVAYVSMGRRLGFPLKLASANGIPCVRWEDANARFEVPGLREGAEALRMEHPQKWNEPSPALVNEEPPETTRALAPRDELSIFLGMRAVRLEQSGFYAKALVAFAQAHCLSPPCLDHVKGIRRVAQKITPLAGQSGPNIAAQYPKSASDEVTQLNRINQMNAELRDLQHQRSPGWNQTTTRDRSQP